MGNVLLFHEFRQSWNCFLAAKLILPIDVKSQNLLGTKLSDLIASSFKVNLGCSSQFVMDRLSCLGAA